MTHATKVDFRTYLVGGASNLSANVEKGYAPMRLRNAQDEMEYVELMEPEKLENLPELSESDLMSLKKDVKDALSKHPPIVQRIIFKIFCQGQSFKEAVATLKRPESYYRRLIYNKVIPQLQEDLKGYFEDGKVVL